MSDTAVLVAVVGGVWVLVQIGDRLWKRNGKNGNPNGEVTEALNELVEISKRHLEIEELRHQENIRQLDRIEAGISK